jgi:hypothetical protein
MLTSNAYRAICLTDGCVSGQKGTLRYAGENRGIASAGGWKTPITGSVEISFPTVN